MSDTNLPLAGAVHTLRVLADRTVAITLHFEPKDRMAAMEMMGEPGAAIACVRLKDGYDAKPAAAPATFRDFGPICREAIELCKMPQFKRWREKCGALLPAECDDECAKAFILSTCNVTSRKDLDAAEGARELFIAHVRKPFHAWLEKQR